jgi:hypothetical protein
MRSLFLAIAAGAGALASAPVHAAQAVDQSAGAHHAAVCPPAKKPLQARCHARVVTDSAGNPIVNAHGATPPGSGTEAQPSTQPPGRAVRHDPAP